MPEDTRTAIFRRLAGDHLGVATVELAGTQRQAEPPGEVVKPV